MRLSSSDALLPPPVLLVVLMRLLLRGAVLEAMALRGRWGRWPPGEAGGELAMAGDGGGRWSCASWRRDGLVARRVVVAKAKGSAAMGSGDQEGPRERKGGRRLQGVIRLQAEAEALALGFFSRKKCPRQSRGRAVGGRLVVGVAVRNGRSQVAASQSSGRERMGSETSVYPNQGCGGIVIKQGRESEPATDSTSFQRREGRVWTTGARIARKDVCGFRREGLRRRRRRGHDAMDEETKSWNKTRQRAEEEKRWL